MSSYLFLDVILIDYRTASWNDLANVAHRAVFTLLLAGPHSVKTASIGTLGRTRNPMVVTVPSAPDVPESSMMLEDSENVSTSPCFPLFKPYHTQRAFQTQRMLICFQWYINYISILFNLYIFSSISAFNSFILPGYHWLHVSITLLHSFFKTAANCNAINNTFPCICSKTFIGCIHVLVLLSAIDIPSCSLCAPRPTQSHLSSPHLLTASSNPTPCIHPLA